MIGKLISMLFNFLLGLLSTVIQIICLPINALITSTMPDLAQQMTNASNGLQSLFAILPWALSLVPAFLLTTLAFCYGLRVVVSTIALSSHQLEKIWNVLQKIKFW